MAGAFVISLDLELMWGVRDHRSPADYGDAVMGGRAAIPAMLALFKKKGIHATWATVGFLFARNRDELMDFTPGILPDYRDKQFSPYAAFSQEIGSDETTDPLHFGYSLIEQITATEHQEIATHTFSHYYCLEERQNFEAFEADIAAAIAIARARGIEVFSIVFPRNQLSGEYVEICTRHGISAFRGNPGGIAYRSRKTAENGFAVRAFRYLDSVLPAAGDNSFLPRIENGCVNICASRFLRPVSGQVITSLQLRRIKREMEAAAKRGRYYHLWWHPHNFGRNTDENLANLDKILEHYRQLRNKFGMESLTMREAARRFQNR